MVQMAKFHGDCDELYEIGLTSSCEVRFVVVGPSAMLGRYRRRQFRTRWNCAAARMACPVWIRWGRGVGRTARSAIDRILCWPVPDRPHQARASTPAVTYATNGRTVTSPCPRCPRVRTCSPRSRSPIPHPAAPTTPDGWASGYDRERRGAGMGCDTLPSSERTTGCGHEGGK
jgi:hypothetical protein